MGIFLSLPKKTCLGFYMRSLTAKFQPSYFKTEEEQTKQKFTGKLEKKMLGDSHDSRLISKYRMYIFFLNCKSNQRLSKHVFIHIVYGIM